MKNLYLNATFLTTLIFSGTANAYGLFTHPSSKEGGCLSVKDNNIVLALGDSCKPTEVNTHWELEKLDGGLFFIHHAAAEDGKAGNCLTFAGDKVMLQGCNKSNTRQQWKVSDNAEKTTISNESKCLSAFSHPKGTTVDFQDCKGADDDTDWVWKVNK
jgi:hypothetical protein